MNMARSTDLAAWQWQFRRVHLRMFVIELLGGELMNTLGARQGLIEVARTLCERGVVLVPLVSHTALAYAMRSLVVPVERSGHGSLRGAGCWLIG